MELIIHGILKQIFPIQSGVGSTGKEWKKQDFVITTIEQYAKDVCLQAWNKTTEYVDNLQEGDNVQVSFNAESRQWNDKWITNLTAWKIVKQNNTTFEGNAQNKQSYQKELQNANETIIKAMQTPEMQTPEMQQAIKRSANTYQNVPEIQLEPTEDLPF